MTFNNPYEFLMYGWVFGVAFHATMHYAFKVMAAYRAFDFWGG